MSGHERGEHPNERGEQSTVATTRLDGLIEECLELGRGDLCRGAEGIG